MAVEAKTVIVKGASQGIGAGVARAFLERGYRIVASSCRITKSGAFSASDHVVLVDGDIGDPQTATKIAETAIPRGMRFHLPSYLVADLEGRLQTADVLFHLVYMADGTQSRFDRLSPAQREAVRACLRFTLSDPLREFVHPMIEAALRGYWIDRREL